MRARNYLILCATVAVLVSLTVLFVPGVGDTIEQIMLGFLATRA